jgi:hypothetical protein
MTRRNNKVSVYLSDAELSQIREWADEAEKPVSQLLRDAVLEYTDRDRVKRIEDDIGGIDEKLDQLLAQIDTEHTHTRSRNSDSRQQSVPETTREIAQIVYDKHGVPVPDKDVELVIENNAGGTDRTKRQYKSQLKKRELLFKHPAAEVWTDDKEQWVGWQVKATPGEVDVDAVTDEYGMRTDEFEKIAEAIE